MDKKITIQKIEEAIKNKTYNIERDYACDCTLEWHDDCGLQAEAGNECWISHTFAINGYGPVISYAAYDTYYNHTGIPDQDIIDLLDQYNIIRDISIDDNHDWDTLVRSWVDSAPNGTRYYRDDMRGFANEFIIYVILPGAKPEIDITNLAEITDYDDIIHGIGYQGDAATADYHRLIVVS